MSLPLPDSALYLVIGLLILLAALAFAYFIRRKKNAPQKHLTLTLERPKASLADPLKRLFSGSNRQVEELLPELEEILLSSDVGVNMTTRLLEKLRASEVKNSDQAYPFVKDQIKAALIPQTPFTLPSHRPAVFFFVGVNGVGKTTTIGKLASRWKQEGLKPLVVAGDTFRAAAQEQLKIWADRAVIDYVGSQANADPASVVFDGIAAAKARGSDLVLIDTAGRLQTKAPLMEQLKKMVRVAEKEIGRAPDEIFLVLDATTGQNGLSQAKVFQEAVPLTGLILTKYDGTSKGGILLSVTNETGLPLRFIGVGERQDDLKPFDPTDFVESLFGE